MTEAGLEQIFLRGSVAAGRFARDEPLGFQGRHPQIKDEVLAGKSIDAVLEMLDPFQECRALSGRNTSGLMGEVGSHIAVGENNLAVVQSGFQFRLGFKAVAGVKEGSEVGIDTFERAKITVQE